MSDDKNLILHRGVFDRYFDRVLSWWIGYPPERCEYTTQDVRIPIADGLEHLQLAAVLMQPVLSSGSKPRGTVLVRSPYGRTLPIAMSARVYAARGYNALLVSCRGTFGSGGEFDPFRTEVQDGAGVVEWMREQDWYTGTFATCGGSYLGFVQWATLYDAPKDLVAAVPCVSPHDFSRSLWPTGATNLDFVKWADMIARQEEPRSILTNLLRSRERKLEAALNSTPLITGAKTLLAGKTPWLDAILSKSNLNDPYYTPMKLGQALERTDLPVLIITCWYDLFAEQSLEQYARLKERGCNVALTIGPWNHVKSVLAIEMNRHGFDWIENHLAENKEAKRDAPVQYFVTGANEWRHALEYPPPTKSSTYYLHKGGALKSEPFQNDLAASKFTFDPRSPTPTIGGTGLLTGGSLDDTSLAKRTDVLIFDTAALEQDLEICGQPNVEISHSTSSPFADIFVRVSEVDKKGRSHNVTEMFQRLDPHRDQSAAIKLVLNHCAHRFAQGTKIRFMVAGGNFPQYVRNHGVENSDGLGTEMCTVEHTVHHNSARMSKVVLPVV